MTEKVLKFKSKDVEDLSEFMMKEHKTKSFVLGFINEDGDFVTYISSETRDIDLCYIIQTLKDRRTLDFINEPELF